MDKLNNMNGNTLLATVVAVVAIAVVAVLGAVMSDVFISTGKDIAGANATLTNSVSNEVNTRYPQVVKIIFMAVTLLVLLMIFLLLIRNIGA